MNNIHNDNYYMQNDFEDWYLSFPDNDESLLEDKTESGNRYKNETVDLMWFSFKAGYCYGFHSNE